MTDGSDFSLKHRLARLAKKYAAYGHCPTCDALPGNPCRETVLGSRRSLLDKPHSARPEPGVSAVAS